MNLLTKSQKQIRVFISMLVLVSVSFFACQDAIVEEQLVVDSHAEQLESINAEPIPEQYIVVYNESSLNFRIDPADYEGGYELLRKETDLLLRTHAIHSDSVKQIFALGLNGFVVKMSAESKDKLQADPKVRKIVQDKVRFLSVMQGNRPIRDQNIPEVENTQTIPWGVSRVGGPFDYKGTRKVWVIDTGIDLNHPDLNVDTRHGFDAYNPRRDWNFDDEHGHGTHVAGTIGALNNHFGVVGVAAGVPVVPVKVFFGPNAQATDSGILAGVEYVGKMGRPGDVANLSFGWQDEEYTLLDEAVLQISERKKIWMVIASGNSRLPGNTFTPARVNGNYTITVSAIDQADRLAWFSHFGYPIKFGAPGVNVFSTWRGGAYRNSAGTSMAAPHIAGLRVFGSLETDGYVKNYPIDYLDPIAIRTRGAEGMGYIKP
ncbi:Subtilisin Savinase (Alkaline protease) [Indibacter alkaliphilus LW1]|uniref:Subtilisin Savinase (Alkaline protease) n=1 Tax=Indibacter alkaliphilus (strain CCUG 57479 / KCTC 22604 / LW1) TaxID=1189612 RepID=S2DM92_INDAL|nr:S8 family serine peptidase [Indibacter alkaliphilus]EOZ98320.1 Subtilisin Savinase (Alkaline protease) [Indibacter alkaliphilus LW1]